MLRQPSPDRIAAASQANDTAKAAGNQASSLDELTKGMEAATKSAGSLGDAVKEMTDKLDTFGGKGRFFPDAAASWDEQGKPIKKTAKDITTDASDPGSKRVTAYKVLGSDCFGISLTAMLQTWLKTF